MLLAASDTGLGVLMAAMGALWLIATIHHSRLAKHAVPAPSDRSSAGHKRRAARAAGVS